MADASREHLARANHGRIGLLASVRSLAEAEQAVAGGADLIDMKEPRHGALGAVETTVIQQVVARYHALRPLSATVGDLPAAVDGEYLCERVRAVADCGVDYVKVGLRCGAGSSSASSAEALVRHLAPLAADGIPLVMVVAADHGLPDADLVDALAAAGVLGVMLDTEDKGLGSLCQVLSVASIAGFCALVRRRGLLLGLAGSLIMDDIAALAPLAPDYLGFRGALCRSGRSGELDGLLVREARFRLDQVSPARRRITGGDGSAVASGFDC